MPVTGDPGVQSPVSVTLPSTTSPLGAGELAAAVGAVVAIGQAYGLTGPERECVAGRLVQRRVDVAGLEGVHPPDLDPGVRGAVERAVHECVHEHSFTEAFVSSFAQDHPEVTEVQLRCLAEGYRALSLEELDRVIELGNNPQSTADGGAIIDRLLADCGVSR